MRSGSPYTAAVDEKMIRPVPARRMASSRASVPPRLFAQYLAGSATDSPTSELPAKCSTASMSRSASTLAALSLIVPRTNAAPSGYCVFVPGDRSSRTVTS